jgi:hypothetical protein
MEQLKARDVVVFRKFPKRMRGEVLRVTDDGLFITVNWTGWPGNGRTSMHRPDDLVRVTAHEASLG